MTTQTATHQRPQRTVPPIPGAHLEQVHAIFGNIAAISGGVRFDVPIVIHHHGGTEVKCVEKQIVMVTGWQDV